MSNGGGVYGVMFTPHACNAGACEFVTRSGMQVSKKQNISSPRKKSV